MCPSSCLFLPILVQLAVAPGENATLSIAKVRRTLRWWALLVGALLIAVAAGLYLVMYLSDWQLREAIAEADRLDPGWRFADLEAVRALVPDAENSAKLVQWAGARMPHPLHVSPLDNDTDELEERLSAGLSQRPDEATRKDLRELLAEFAEAVAKARGFTDRKARGLADLPRGRHTVDWSKDLVNTDMRHLQAVRDVARLVSLDARQHALDGDLDGAVRSCQAVLNTGRSLGDEPSEKSQFSRAVCSRRALRALEQTLAQGEASTKVLEDLQRLLTEEAEEPLELRAARAERVMFYQCLEVMRGGPFNRYGGLGPGTAGAVAHDLDDQLRAPACQAAYLRFFNEVVEIAKLPSEQQQERFQKLQKPRQNLPKLLEERTHGRDWSRLAESFHRNTAQLRCAAAALAAERYRLAEGHWPENLDILVPRYLTAVPTDPFDGQPLRLKRSEDRLVIYSVGVDKKDNGGNLSRQWDEPQGTEVGFRLWDVGQRGKPPVEK
jgi:hypothetical protein